MKENRHERPVIGLVGPCGAGKSTLAERLRKHGYRVKHIAQEHSFIPNMWQRLVNPDVLIFLDASHAVTNARRNLGWTEADYLEQQRRLAHARQHADLYIFTDTMSVEEVEQKILTFLEQRR
ncbi:MAG: hypothetical protein DDG60_10175 [Anaerolineae bacterium]|nr:MAG: hypothetical protein DDG60_10175 [Anaerolineae bacterium]